MKRLCLLMLLLARAFAQTPHTAATIQDPNVFQAVNTFNQPLVFLEGVCISGIIGSETLCADSGTHRFIFNPNNSGAMYFVGVGTPGTPNNCPEFAANGIDIVDSGSPCQVAVANGAPPAGISYVWGPQLSSTTPLAWSQGIAASLTGGTPATVTLNPCPVGVDTASGFGYQVRLSGGGNSEAVNVTGGSCPVTGGGTGTIIFTPFFSYSNPYTVGSASSGIQETINSVCGANATYYQNRQCNVTIPANGPIYNAPVFNTYNVYGTIFLHMSQSVLDGSGVALNCLGRGACIQVGDLTNSNDFPSITIKGIAFREPTDHTSDAAFHGVNITNTVVAGNVATISTAAAHGFRVGDMVTIMFTDDSAYWGDAIIVSVPTSTSFTYAHPKNSGTIATHATPGLVALAHVAVLDNAINTNLVDLSMDFAGNNGQFNNFFDFWDDENATISHFNNSAISMNNGQNWTSSIVYSGGAGNAANSSQQFAPVISWRDSTVTANFNNCATIYNNNGFYMENVVCQATGLWEVNSSNTRGNFQGSYIKNIYSETGPSNNPVSPVHTPFPGMGIAGWIAGTSTGAAFNQLDGSGSVGDGFNTFASGGTGATPYTYYIVANDVTAGRQTSPMKILNWLSTGSDSPVITWPRIANGTDVITYDVIRATSVGDFGSTYPANGSCTGGTGGACGSVATAISQATACGGTLVCSFTDTISSSTSSYTINEGNYVGPLNFWPGSLVVVGGTDTAAIRTSVEQIGVVGIGLGSNALQITNSCNSVGQTSAGGGYTACYASINTANNATASQTAALMGDGTNTGSGQTLTKGRLNFMGSGYTTAVNPHHFITFVDSEPNKTMATVGYRPLANLHDVWVGTDSASGVGTNTTARLAFGSPTSITNYIGNTGDNISWLERLTSTGKTFAVPVLFGSALNQLAARTIGGTCSMSSSTTCTIALSVTYSTPVCIATEQGGGSPIAAACGVSGSTVTVTAASSNSATWGAMVFGNPN